MIPPHHFINHKICSVLDGDLALPVIHPQHGLTLPTPLRHDANFPLIVTTVIGGVLAQGQSCLVCFTTENSKLFNLPGDQYFPLAPLTQKNQCLNLERFLRC